MCSVVAYIHPLHNLSLVSAFKYFPGDRKDRGRGFRQPGKVVKNRWRKAPIGETSSESARAAHMSPTLNELMTEGFSLSTSVPDV